MLNPYSLILGLFTVAGLGTAIWGWHILARGKQTLRWPTVSGTITCSQDNNDLLPQIEYRYSVAGRDYHRQMEFPADLSPTEQFKTRYLEKFPVGSQITVYYDPDHPDRSTMEPGPRRGDGLVFALGLGMTVIGLLLLLVS